MLQIIFTIVNYLHLKDTKKNHTYAFQNWFCMTFVRNLYFRLQFPAGFHEYFVIPQTFASEMIVDRLKFACRRCRGGTWKVSHCPILLRVSRLCCWHDEIAKSITRFAALRVIYIISVDHRFTCLIILLPKFRLTAEITATSRHIKISL